MEDSTVDGDGTKQKESDHVIASLASCLPP